MNGRALRGEVQPNHGTQDAGKAVTVDRPPRAGRRDTGARPSPCSPPDADTPSRRYATRSREAPVCCIATLGRYRKAPQSWQR